MGYLTFNNTTAPATPASGKVVLYTPSSANIAASTPAKRLCFIDDSGLTDQVGNCPKTWYDVTNYGLKGDGSTDNLAAWNTFFTNVVGVNATIYFPAGTYNFSGELTLNTDEHLQIIGCGRARSMIQSTSATANLFNITVAAYYIDFIDLGFTCSTTKTAGSYIAATNNNAYLNVKNCEMQKYFSGVSLTGSIAANMGVIDDCQFTSPATNGTAITIFGSTINVVIHNTTINSGTTAGTTGINIQQSGSVQITDCDLMGGVNCLLVNPTSPNVVSSIFVLNTFFDQSTLGSTVKFSGTGACSRVRFIECGITCGVVGGAGVTACEIAGSGTTIYIPEAIEFVGCDFYNNGGSGTTNGILVTGCKGFGVHDCVIAGFTNGINVTPYNTNGYTHFIINNNRIGTAQNFAGNGTGLLLNAGAVQYGACILTNNDFSGNTTADITNNATFANTGMITVRGNIGLVDEPHGNAPGTVLPLTTTTRMGVSIPAPGSSYTVGVGMRIIAFVTCSASSIQTLTLTLRFGTADSNADTALVTLALGAGTAAVGGAKIIAEFQIVSLGSSGTAMAGITVLNNGTTGVTNAIAQSAFTTTPAVVNTTNNNFLGLYGSDSVNGIITVRDVYYEII